MRGSLLDRHYGESIHSNFFIQGLVIVEPAEKLLFLDSEREFLTGSEVVIPLNIMSRSGQPVSR